MGELKRFLKSHFIEHVELRTDVARAFRAVVAFTVPLALFHSLHQPAESLFISTASLNLSLPDLRGAYRVRLGILATMTLLAAGSAFLGVCSAGNPAGAVMAMGIIALLGGVWRHLSADYGPGMAVSSALLFLLGLSQAGGVAAAWPLAEMTALGGLFATLVHACTWLFRPQHALRYAVAETWVAASDLVAAMRPPSGEQRPTASVSAREGELRAALDRTFIILGGAEGHKQTGLVLTLEEMRREVVHLTMRVIAFNTSLEPLLSRPDFARCLPALDSVLKALSDATRSVAITLIMHRPENLAATRVRLRREHHLATALDEQMTALPDGGTTVAQARAALAQVIKALPRIAAALAQTADPRPATLTLAASLPELGSYSIRSLAAWIRPAPRLDPVLVRHSVRMAVFTMFATAIYVGYDIPHGYWIAFTIMVVLQPDYGSTRQRAAARIAGTVAGILLAGALLWSRLPLPLLDLLAAAAAFTFAYFLKQRYWLAIFFITVNLVLITDTLATVHQDFMIARVLATLTGGALALVAARVFWPIWEGEQFPTLLATALRANQAFLASLAAGLDPAAEKSDSLMARRRAENANRNVAASVERLRLEPTTIQENPERAAALATYCQRITRALTVLAVYSLSVGKSGDTAAAAMLRPMSDLLTRLATMIETGCSSEAGPTLNTDLGKLEVQFASAEVFSRSDRGWMGSPTGLIWIQIGKTIAELRAMTLAMEMKPTAAGAA